MKRSLEYFLGISFGLGSATILRVANFFGPSEFFMLLFFVTSFLIYRNKVFTFNNYFHIYLFFVLVIVAPITSFLVFLNTNHEVSLEYVPHFIFVFFLISAFFNSFNDINLNKVINIFFVIHILVLLAGFIYGGGVDFETRSYGLSKNVNQIAFYSSSLMLLISIYSESFKLLKLITVFILTIPTLSDAFILSTLIGLFLFSITFLIFKTRIKSKSLFLGSIFLTTSLSFFVIFQYSDLLIDLWNSADEGGKRIMLIESGIESLLISPFIGLGFGSYANNGISYGWESHNTFVDLALYFGLVFSVITYLIYAMSAYKCFVSKNALGFSFFIAFIVSTMFHFTGRHYFFWFQLILFYQFIKNNK